MLFDQRPKDNKRDLYDAEDELESLISALRGGAPLVTIVGLRTAGNTPLLLTALNQTAQPSIALDMRVLASKPTPRPGSRAFDGGRGPPARSR